MLVRYLCFVVDIVCVFFFVKEYDVVVMLVFECGDYWMVIIELEMCLKICMVVGNFFYYDYFLNFVDEWVILIIN